MNTGLRVDAFDYDLPAELVAQQPAPRRDGSRLLVLDRVVGAAGGLRHIQFTDLPSLLAPGDLLVLNDTRVIPARLVGSRTAPGTGGRVEVLLIERLRPGRHVWRALLKGSCRPGEPVDFGGGLFGSLVRRGSQDVDIELSVVPDSGMVDQALQRVGRMPLPPYIQRGEDPDTTDRSRYQTVYARSPGAVAAPTAGLHFTEALLRTIVEAGVAVQYLTLHVGPGTFQPVRAIHVHEHRMHPERFILPGSLALAVAAARKRKGRVVAVGTTVARVLESRAGATRDRVEPGEGACDLFIYPGYQFKMVDAMVTNFHLPRSTLLMLVCAFAGTETIKAAYAEAIAAKYRFYSYGDAMFLH